jgi:hypothetical protein
MIRCEIHAYRRKFEYQLAFSKNARIRDLTTIQKSSQPIILRYWYRNKEVNQDSTENLATILEKNLQADQGSNMKWPL